MEINKKIIKKLIDALDDLSRIIDSIAGHLPMEIKQKQEILETADFQLRAEILIAFIQMKNMEMLTFSVILGVKLLDC